MSEAKKENKIELIEYNMPVPKETKEVIDLANMVLEKIMNGEDISTFMELMDELYLAADGANKIGYEASSPYKDEIAGYLVHKMMGTILAKKK